MSGKSSLLVGKKEAAGMERGVLLANEQEELVVSEQKKEAAGSVNS